MPTSVHSFDDPVAVHHRRTVVRGLTMAVAAGILSATPLTIAPSRLALTRRTADAQVVAAVGPRAVAVAPRVVAATQVVAPRVAVVAPLAARLLALPRPLAEQAPVQAARDLARPKAAPAHTMDGSVRAHRAAWRRRYPVRRSRELRSATSSRVAGRAKSARVQPVGCGQARRDASIRSRLHAPPPATKMYRKMKQYRIAPSPPFISGKKPFGLWE
jgi:hypothetical protein